jgi:hypothetical protein
MAYATLQQVRDYQGAGGTTMGTVDDALLSALIARAQAWIESPDGAGMVFEATADTVRLFDAERDVCGRTLKLDYPCLSITTLVNGDGATVAASEYVTGVARNRTPFYRVTLKTTSTTVWTWTTAPENAISITGRWGYTLTAPADITHATIRLVHWLYRQKDTAGADQPLLAGDGTVVLPAVIPADVRSIVRAYRDRLL